MTNDLNTQLPSLPLKHFWRIRPLYQGSRIVEVQIRRKRWLGSIEVTSGTTMFKRYTSTIEVTSDTIVFKRYTSTQESIVSVAYQVRGRFYKYTRESSEALNASGDYSGGNK